MRRDWLSPGVCVRIVCAALLVVSGRVYGVAVQARPLLEALAAVSVPAPPGPIVQRLAADQPRVHVLRAIETDLDRDGDLDVVASTTDAVVQVWINVGNGHFVLRADPSSSVMTTGGAMASPRSAGAIMAVSPGSKWSARFDAVRVVFSPSRPCAVAAVQVRARRLDLLPYRPLRAPPVLS